MPSSIGHAVLSFNDSTYSQGCGTNTRFSYNLACLGIVVSLRKSVIYSRLWFEALLIVSTRVPLTPSSSQLYVCLGSSTPPTSGIGFQLSDTLDIITNQKMHTFLLLLTDIWWPQETTNININQYYLYSKLYRRCHFTFLSDQVTCLDNKLNHSDINFTWFMYRN